MLFKKLVLICLFVLRLALIATAQQEEINFTSLTTKDGLSTNSVNVILKDRYGLIWFGTEDGLNKFDGTNFTVYRNKPGDTTTLQANEILSLHEDKKGNLWVGTGGGSLSLYDRKRNAFINFPASEAPNTIKSNVIRSICSDYLGRIWIAHFNGINILDPVTKRISDFPLTSRQSGSLTLSGMYVFEDSRHQIWIGTSNGLFRYNPKTKILAQFVHSSQDPLSLGGNYINTVAEDKKGNIWVGTTEGLSMLKPGTNSFINYRKSSGNHKTLSSNLINSIAVEGDSLWIGTDDGLDILDTRTGEFTTYKHNFRDIYSLNAKSIRSVYIDQQGIYWLGTVSGGVNKYDKNLNLFNFVQSNVFDEKGLNAPIVTSFAEDDKGNVYVGTEGGGLSLFERNTKLFRHFNIRSSKNSTNHHLTILSLKMSRKNQLLIGTYSDGLFQFDPASGRYQQLLQGTGVKDLNANDIFCIEEDRKGNIWVGTNGAGINVLNSALEVIVRYTPDPKTVQDQKLPINGFIRDIEEDRDGNIWIATHGGGIAVFYPSTGNFTIYNTMNSQLPNDKIRSILEDSRGIIWVGTFGGGLALFNKKTKSFTALSEKEGLANNTVHELLEDNKGLIWASTNKGISSIDAVTKKIYNYNYHNGIQKNNFVRGAGLRLSNGELYFGGLEGFNYFNPEHLKKNNNIPSVLITDLRISNQSVTASEEDGPIKEHISVAKEIHLDYKQNFALSFVGLNFTSPEQNQYAYKLEGFDKDWNYVGSSTTTAYTNLDPGEYIFRVRAGNNEGIWNTEGTSIKIYVHPPFWRTVYAYTFYILAIIGLLLFLRYKGIQKLKRKFALEQERIHAEQERKEAERIHELDQLKIKFLTNLSHEFRTPISLILGPVDKLLSQEKSEQASSQLHMVKRNAKRLLNLVNQLLDFRKMEEHELKLHASEGELVSFVKEVSDSFKDLSERKKIDFAFKSQFDRLYTLFDHDKLERILFNLLSNAFKFTLEGGKISLELEYSDNTSDPSQKWISIKVHDTGIGIPEDKKEKIFERFFQNTTAAAILNQGTGIGLSITKEFVKMHGGTIDVDSEPGKGTTFSIHLPFIPLEVPQDDGEALQEKTEPYIEAEHLEEAAETANEIGVLKSKTDVPSILLVEDNDDFRFYLKDNLRLHYKVFEAANGKEGWQKALAHHPQLIVSDISMPYMDGIELSRKIKSDKRTSHIPVILLTALIGEEDQLKGLGTGANDYITKPFNFEVLNAKIKNLLVLNSILKSTYTKQIKVIHPEVTIESDDEKLLSKIMLYLEENLTNSQLSVEELSKHVGMSRSSLYSKLLELTGQTPVEYIRSVKLDKAAVLLEKSNMNIAQVAYSVGFSTPNYFARSFKAKFNMLPSEYINKMRKEEGLKNTDN